MEKAERWWVASAWLWLMVFVNAISVAFLAVALSGHVPITKTPSAAQIYALLASVAQIVCIVAIFEWQRWGWWGLLAIGLITFCVNVAVGHGLLLPMIGLAGLGTTFLVLRGGGKSAVWSQMR